MTTHTHSYAKISVPRLVLSHVAHKLEEAGYNDAVTRNEAGDVMLADMHGLALVEGPLSNEQAQRGFNAMVEMCDSMDVAEGMDTESLYEKYCELTGHYDVRSIECAIMDEVGYRMRHPIRSWIKRLWRRLT